MGALEKEKAESEKKRARMEDEEVERAMAS